MTIPWDEIRGLQSFTIQQSKTMIFYCDGACESVNPGGFGTAAWCVDGAPEHGVLRLGRFWKMENGSKIMMSNNIAEYMAVEGALLHADKTKKLRTLLDHNKDVIVRTDSMLVVKQLLGEWRCNAPYLDELRRRCLGLIASLRADGSVVTFEWVPREQNARADALSRSIYEDPGDVDGY